MIQLRAGNLPDRRGNPAPHAASSHQPGPSGLDPRADRHPVNQHVPTLGAVAVRHHQSSR